MFELFLALFGGAYYGAKIASDKAALKAHNMGIDAVIAWRKDRVEKWAAQVADHALQEDLAYFIADPQNYDEVWKEVHDAYQQMPSHRGSTQILLYESMVSTLYGKDRFTKKQRENIAAAFRDDALDIMLARRGKVRYINTTIYGLEKTISPGYGEHSRAEWDRTFDMWLYLRDELRRHGVNARAIFKTGGSTENRQTAFDLEDVEKFRYEWGIFTWLPLTCFDENLRFVD